LYELLKTITTKGKVRVFTCMIIPDFQIGNDAQYYIVASLKTY